MRPTGIEPEHDTFIVADIWHLPDRTVFLVGVTPVKFQHFLGQVCE